MRSAAQPTQSPARPDNRLSRWINRALPVSIRPEPTIIHYVLLRATRRQSAILRVVSTLSAIGSVLILIAIGYWLGEVNGHRTFLDRLNPVDGLYLILFWPLAVIQIGLRLGALIATTGIAASEIRRGTWETLRATTDGASSTLRMHFLAVFYRLRPLLIGLIGLRLLFFAGMLINFTAFNGALLDNMIVGTIPFGTAGVPAFARTGLAVLFVVLGVLASLILPISALAFDSAVGAWISTMAQRDWLGILLQAALLLGRLALSMAALWVGSLAIFGTDQVLNLPGLHNTLAIESTVGRWVGGWFGLAEGDWGLSLLHQAHTQILWADIPGGVLVSGAVLLYALIQLAGAARLLHIAIQRAERPAYR